MILINVKYKVLPEHVETFLDDVAWFTEATRAEEGNIFFEWYRDPQNPDEFLLIEAFHDDADVAHVQSDHFKRCCDEMPSLLVETPRIINTKIPGKTEWDEMAEFQVK